jgi:hypothetical protein
MKRLSIVLALTLGIIIYSSCGIPAGQQARVTGEQLRDCERKMHISFPPSTQPLGINEVKGWLDDSTYLKVQIPRGDLDGFLKTSPFAGEQLRSDRPDVSDSESIPWWKPESVKNYKSGQVLLPDAKYVSTLLDLDSEDKVIVYLQWNET